MEINIKILNKFNRYQQEIMDYYKLDIEIWISTFAFNGEMHQVNTFYITSLGYELSRIDAGVDDKRMSKECLAKRLDFFRNKYPLLTPFYSFSSYLVHTKTLQRQMKLKKDVFESINKNVQYVRDRNDTEKVS